MRPLSYWRHCEVLSGVEVAEVKWTESRQRSLELAENTQEIARRLEAGGVKTRRENGGDLTVVGVFTGQSEQPEAWRHINFLPTVAAMNRSQLVKKLAFFVDNPETSRTRARAHNARARHARAREARYFVLTNGRRCRVEELRGRLQALHRAVSRIAAHPDVKAHGVTFQLRVSELTVERDDDGNATYHPHANVIVTSSKRVDWSAFRSLMWRLVPGHWNDCGRLLDANEAVKYFVKPAEILALNPQELAQLFEATFGLRMATPMNDFKEFGRWLALERLKLSKIISRESGDVENWKWCFVKRQSSAEKLPARTQAADTVLAVMSPQPRFTSRFEPCVLVRNFSGSLETVLRVNNLESAFAESRRSWENRAARTEFTPSPQLSENSDSKPTRTYELRPHKPPLQMVRTRTPAKKTRSTWTFTPNVFAEM